MEGTAEDTELYLPRIDALHTDPAANIFALGTAIYHAMQSHECYLEHDSLRDRWSTRRYRDGRFPEDLQPALGGDEVRNNWNVGYVLADQVVEGLEALESGVYCIDILGTIVS